MVLTSWTASGRFHSFGLSFFGGVNHLDNRGSFGSTRLSPLYFLVKQVGSASTEERTASIVVANRVMPIVLRRPDRITPGIRWSSPTQLLIQRYPACLWGSGRDPEVSRSYGRT
ncbi:hypothetical protein F4780DRAFT_721798 [Xylariomycetidae sp. FL0641]|nr:hypothetical protein F4780DRAFT_721798 [Xylariomycetidae sp. FL0641]